MSQLGLSYTHLKFYVALFGLAGCALRLNEGSQSEWGLRYVAKEFKGRLCT